VLHTSHTYHSTPIFALAIDWIFESVIAALWYLGKINVNESVINKIRKQLTEQQFAELIKHTNKMPYWMSSAFENYKE